MSVIREGFVIRNVDGTAFERLVKRRRHRLRATGAAFRRTRIELLSQERGRAFSDNERAEIDASLEESAKDLWNRGLSDALLGNWSGLLAPQSDRAADAAERDE